MNGEPKTFDQFVDYATRELHDALLQGGSCEMRSKLYVLLPYYVRWRRAQGGEAKKGKS